jgi:hypothetical protein
LPHLELSAACQQGGSRFVKLPLLEISRASDLKQLENR